MVIKKSNDKKELLPVINQFIENSSPQGKGWFLVISTPGELIIRKSGQKNLLELEGVGKEIWEATDVENYINKERSAWD
jgi:hypothetical protein